MRTVYLVSENNHPQYQSQYLIKPKLFRYSEPLGRILLWGFSNLTRVMLWSLKIIRVTIPRMPRIMRPFHGLERPGLEGGQLIVAHG